MVFHVNKPLGILFFLTSLPLAMNIQFCYYASDMTAYTIPREQTLSSDVAARKAARRKIIERARKLEADSYKAMMQKRRQLQTQSDLATHEAPNHQS